MLAVVSVVLALGAAFLVPMPGVAARAEQQLVPGLGAWSSDRSDFVGFYKALVDGRWTKVYCIRPNSAEPTSVSLRTLIRLPNTSRAVTRQLAQTLTAHGDARTVVQAAAVSQALNEEIGNHRAVARRAQRLPDRVQSLTERYVEQARAQHAPLRLAIDLPRSPLPGRSARGTVALSSASGPARGAVRLTHTANANTPDELTIGRSGRASFRYDTVAGGPVHITATAQVVPTTLRASSPGTDEQLMVGWSAPVNVRASATYEATGPGISYRYACSSECAGKPVVTLRACAPANRYASAITFWLGEQVSRRIRFAAARERQCKSFATALGDGTPVGAVWHYRTPDGWTRKYPATGSFVVDCPPPPPVAVAASFNCSRARISATLGTEREGTLRRLYNRTTHRMVLIVRGAVSDEYVVPPGTRATVHSFRVPCGTGASVTLRSGVQRTGGGYNYGDPVKITMP
jgi:hypothetical protein